MCYLPDIINTSQTQSLKRTADGPGEREHPNVRMRGKYISYLAALSCDEIENTRWETRHFHRTFDIRLVPIWNPCDNLTCYRALHLDIGSACPVNPFSGGYPSFDMFQELTQKKQLFVMRLKNSINNYYDLFLSCL